MSSSKRRGASRLKVLSNVGLGVLAVATAGVVASVALIPAEPEPVSAPVASYYENSRTATPSAKPRAVPAPEAIALLADQSRPWTLGVIGDSTGDAPGEWVHLVAAEMSSRYNRPVVIHDWAIETNTYDTVTEVGAGFGAPITVWNGSASGKDLTYAGAHKNTMVPERPDMLIVSHGHNVASAKIASAEIAVLYEWSLSQWESPVAVAVTLQNPQMGRFKDRQEQIVAGLRADWTDSYGSVIDTHTAFMEHPAPGSLLKDDLHPNPAGSELWAKVALGLLAPA